MCPYSTPWCACELLQHNTHVVRLVLLLPLQEATSGSTTIPPPAAAGVQHHASALCAEPGAGSCVPPRQVEVRSLDNPQLVLQQHHPAVPPAVAAQARAHAFAAAHHLSAAGNTSSAGLPLPGAHGSLTPPGLQLRLQGLTVPLKGQVLRRLGAGAQTATAAAGAADAAIRPSGSTSMTPPAAAGVQHHASAPCAEPGAGSCVPPRQAEVRNVDSPQPVLQQQHPAAPCAVAAQAHAFAAASQVTTTGNTSISGLSLLPSHGNLTPSGLQLRLQGLAALLKAAQTLPQPGTGTQEVAAGEASTADAVDAPAQPQVLVGLTAQLRAATAAAGAGPGAAGSCQTAGAGDDQAAAGGQKGVHTPGMLHQQPLQQIFLQQQQQRPQQHHRASTVTVKEAGTTVTGTIDKNLLTPLRKWVQACDIAGDPGSVRVAQLLPHYPKLLTLLERQHSSGKVMASTLYNQVCTLHRFLWANQQALQDGSVNYAAMLSSMHAARSRYKQLQQQQQQEPALPRATAVGATEGAAATAPAATSTQLHSGAHKWTVMDVAPESSHLRCILLRWVQACGIAGDPGSVRVAELLPHYASLSDALDAMHSSKAVSADWVYTQLLALSSFLRDHQQVLKNGSVNYAAMLSSFSTAGDKFRQLKKAAERSRQLAAASQTAAAAPDGDALRASSHLAAATAAGTSAADAAASVAVPQASPGQAGPMAPAQRAAPAGPVAAAAAAATAAGCAQVTFTQLQQRLGGSSSCNGLIVLSRLLQVTPNITADSAVAPVLLTYTNPELLAGCRRNAIAGGMTEHTSISNMLKGLQQLLQQPELDAVLGAAMRQQRLANVSRASLQLQAATQDRRASIAVGAEPARPAAAGSAAAAAAAGPALGPTFAGMHAAGVHDGGSSNQQPGSISGRQGAGLPVGPGMSGFSPQLPGACGSTRHTGAPVDSTQQLAATGDAAAADQAALQMQHSKHGCSPKARPMPQTLAGRKKTTRFASASTPHAAAGPSPNTAARQAALCGSPIQPAAQPAAMTGLEVAADMGCYSSGTIAAPGPTASTAQAALCGSPLQTTAQAAVTDILDAAAGTDGGGSGTIAAPGPTPSTAQAALHGPTLQTAAKAAATAPLEAAAGMDGSDSGAVAAPGPTPSMAQAALHGPLQTAAVTTSRESLPAATTSLCAAADDSSGMENGRSLTFAELRKTLFPHKPSSSSSHGGTTAEAGAAFQLLWLIATQSLGAVSQDGVTVAAAMRVCATYAADALVQLSSSGSSPALATQPASSSTSTVGAAAVSNVAFADACNSILTCRLLLPLLKEPAVQAVLVQEQLEEVCGLLEALAQQGDAGAAGLPEQQEAGAAVDKTQQEQQLGQQQTGVVSSSGGKAGSRTPASASVPTFVGDCEEGIVTYEHARPVPQQAGCTVGGISMTGLLQQLQSNPGLLNGSVGACIQQLERSAACLTGVGLDTIPASLLLTNYIAEVGDRAQQCLSAVGQQGAARTVAGAECLAVMHEIEGLLQLSVQPVLLQLLGCQRLQELVEGLMRCKQRLSEKLKAVGCM